MKKFLSLLLVSLMLVSMTSVLASAEGPRIPYQGENHVTFSDGENFDVADDQLMVWFRPQVVDALKQEGATLDVLNLIAEDMGVDLLICNQSDSKDEFFNLKLQEGKRLELIESMGNMSHYRQQVADGLLEPIPVDLIKECMPDYVKWIEGYCGPDVWKLLAIDGNLYALPNIWSLGANAMGIGIREDIWTANNLAIPTTVADWEAAMPVLKEAGYTPFVGSKDVSEAPVQWIYGAYDAWPTLFYEKDGKIVYGSIQEECKEPLALMADWYAKGYIDNEYATIDDAACQVKWNENKAAATIFYFYCFYPKGAHLGDDYYKVVYGNPDAKVTHIALPKGPTGLSGIPQNPYIGASQRFAAGTPVEKIEKYLKFWNFCSMTQEGIKMLMAGIEGETYTMVDGKPVFVENLADVRNEAQEIVTDHRKDREKLGFDAGFNCIPVSLNNYDMQYWNLDPAYATARVEAPGKNPGKYDIMQTYSRPIWDAKKEQLETMTRDFYYAVITGAKTMADFDAYTAEWLAAGGQEVLDEANAIFYAK